MIAKLSDAEIKTIIPILKAEISGYTKLENAIVSERDLRYQLFLDIQSGKTDPLEWLKQHSKHIIVPPGAIYQPACSQALSIKGYEYSQDQELNIKPSAQPTAIFSFGKEIPAVNKLLLGNNITMESYQKFLENPVNMNDPSYKLIQSILEEVRLFYVKNGFSADYGMSYGTAVSFHHSEDEGYISGVAYNLYVTLFDPAFPEVVKQCRSFLTGPCIEIKAEYNLLDRIFSSGGNSSLLDENIKNYLKKVNITEERYSLIKASLMKARSDSEYPEGIEIPEFDFTPTTQEEKETAKLIAMMKEDALARKSNITIYNKYKAELDPIIDILQKYIGGQ
jgi:hypothetical protein